MDLININLRGTVFVTERDILKMIPGSRLGTLNEESVHYIQSKNEYYFNRNPVVFHQILDYCMTGKLHIPNHVCIESIREEFTYWGIPQGVIEKCCWKNFYQLDEDMNVVKKLLKAIPFKDKCVPVECLKNQQSDKKERWNLRIWKFMNDPPCCTKSKVWYGFLYFIIVSSVAIYIMQSLPSFREELDIYVEYPNSQSHPPTKNAQFLWNTTAIPELLWCDAATNAVLSVDWIIRFVTCPSKLGFFMRILNITDLVAIISIWFAFWLESDSEKRTLFLFSGSYEVLFVVGICYATRIFRIFRLTEHNTGMKILLLSLRSSATELCILVLSFLCFTLIFAVMIFMSEFTSQSSKLTDFYSCSWWSVITMTTVGYGDFVPTTGSGYIVGTLSAIVGILLIALPVAVTSSNFYDFYNFNKYRLRFRNDQYQERVKRSRQRSFSIKSLIWRKKNVSETDVSIDENDEEKIKSSHSEICPIATTDI